MTARVPSARLRPDRHASLLRALGANWLSLYLALAPLVLVACRESSSEPSPETGGLGGLGGGASNGGEKGPRVLSATRVGSSVSIELSDDVYGVWAGYCNQQHARLMKKDGEYWVEVANGAPPCGAPYFLDGNYQQNECNLGCDGGDPCDALPSPLTLSTLEHVRKPSASDGMGGVGGQPEITSFVTQDTQGPYVLDLSYQRACGDVENITVRLPIEVE